LRPARRRRHFLREIESLEGLVAARTGMSHSPAYDQAWRSRKDSCRSRVAPRRRAATCKVEDMAMLVISAEPYQCAGSQLAPESSPPYRAWTCCKCQSPTSEWAHRWHSRFATANRFLRSCADSNRALGFRRRACCRMVSSGWRDPRSKQFRRVLALRVWQ
jgi:hypothetical protein